MSWPSSSSVGLHLICTSHFCTPWNVVIVHPHAETDTTQNNPNYYSSFDLNLNFALMIFINLAIAVPYIPSVLASMFPYGGVKCHVTGCLCVCVGVLLCRYPPGLTCAVLVSAATISHLSSSSPRQCRVVPVLLSSDVVSGPSEGPA